MWEHHEELCLKAKIRVTELNGSRLALEALLQVRVGRKMLWKDLDRNGAVKASVIGEIDLMGR
jgi:hypothetical protein